MSLIKALENLDAIASPAPWFVRYLNDDACMSAIAIATSSDDGASRRDWPDETVVAACLIRSPPYVVPADQRWDGNAELIVGLRNALPDLLRLARAGLAAERGRSDAER